LRLLRLEVEIIDVAVLDLLFERRRDVRLELGLRALAEGHHVVRIDVQLVRVMQLRRLEGQAHRGTARVSEYLTGLQAVHLGRRVALLWNLILEPVGGFEGYGAFLVNMDVR